MNTIQRVISVSGIVAALMMIGAEAYVFLHWLLQQPDLYRWTVQLY